MDSIVAMMMVGTMIGLFSGVLLRLIVLEVQDGRERWRR